MIITILFIARIIDIKKQTCWNNTPSNDLKHMKVWIWPTLKPFIQNN